MKRSLRDVIEAAKFSQPIVDPFPEQSAYQLAKIRAEAASILGFGTVVPKEPECVSIWSAYKAGKEKAYEEIIAAIGDKEIEV